MGLRRGVGREIYEGGVRGGCCGGDSVRGVCGVDSVEEMV